MNKRELKAAKRHRQSKVRQDVLEKALRAIAVLLLESLGEVKPETPAARREAVEAIELAVEVLNGTSA